MFKLFDKKFLTLLFKYSRKQIQHNGISRTNRSLTEKVSMLVRFIDQKKRVLLDYLILLDKYHLNSKPEEIEKKGEYGEIHRVVF